ncbi:NACHT domain-containing protein [Saccharothrix australiensis]|uniref:NACHT domain-containing protein n=1 Tax=Saccharothrix australiensis TaxID=2072 RepID=A0A495WB36_9PSEU|nr:NACHT domain-containing protein [Saccharothrix australiensis]RKT57953.1 NACHT domain-containing protein [Saccharothrix australiensis]
MSRYRQRAVLVGCVLAALLAAAGLFVTDYGIEPDLWLSGLALGFLAFLAAFDPWLHRRRAAGLATDDNLDAATRALAVALHTQWTEECRARGLGEDVLDLHWSSLNGRPGHSDAVVGAFRRQHRMVFLGEAGAGKSTIAMLLTIGLLDHHEGGPVPFPLSLSTWDPEAEDVRTWMTRRLYEEHPALRNTELYGSYAGDLLVEQRRVFPVLDGLDRIPAGKRAEALARINRAFPAATPLVVTSRGDEFDEAGVPVAGADVVRLHPLDHEEIAGYLRSHSDPVTAARWEPIFLHLRAEPDGRLADALSTPLAVWLAGVVYADGEPSELLDRSRFPDRRAIEDHLVDAMVAGAFGDRGVAHQARASQVWPRDKAVRWLTFLAEEMRARGITDLAWWELRRSVGRRWLALLGAVVLGSIGGFGVGWLMAYAGTPRLAPVTGLVAGLAVAVAALNASRSREPKPQLGVWRSLVVVSGVLGTAVGLVFGALYGLSAGLVVGLGLAVAVALRFALGSSAELTHPTGPKWTMARDRIAVWTGSLVLAVVFGAAAGLVFGPKQSGMVGLGLACGLMLGFTLSVLHLRWWWFTVARVWLAVRGKLPWELMVFLDDARRLGVLRQAGACYQFRHALVQERLAGARTPVRSGA